MSAVLYIYILLFIGQFVVFHFRFAIYSSTALFLLHHGYACRRGRGVHGRSTNTKTSRANGNNYKTVLQYARLLYFFFVLHVLRCAYACLPTYLPVERPTRVYFLLISCALPPSPSCHRPSLCLNNVMRWIRFVFTACALRRVWRRKTHARHWFDGGRLARRNCIYLPTYQSTCGIVDCSNGIIICRRITRRFFSLLPSVHIVRARNVWGRQQ